MNVDDLAQEIRRVDGNHDLGSGALAEALMPYLRARSSAPEAREGEAPFGYWVEHKAGNSPMFIPYGSFIPASDNYKITKLYTRPAAPSADKLREALTWALAEIQGDTRYENDGQREAALDQALAALKAEGAK